MSVVVKILIMLDTWVSTIMECFDHLFPYQMDRTSLSIYGGILGLSLMIIGKIFAKMLFDSKHGIFLVFLGVITPLLGAIVSISAARIYLFADADLASLNPYFLYGLLGMGAFLSFLLLAHWFLGLGLFKSLFCLTLTYAFTVGVLYFVQMNQEKIPFFPSTSIEEVDGQ